MTCYVSGGTLNLTQSHTIPHTHTHTHTHTHACVQVNCADVELFQENHRTELEILKTTHGQSLASQASECQMLKLQLDNSRISIDQLKTALGSYQHREVWSFFLRGGEEQRFAADRLVTQQVDL